MEVKKHVFYHHDKTIKHFSFFQCQFARPIWSGIQIVSTLYPPHIATNIFENWFNGVWIVGLRYLLGWERLPLFIHCGYVEMTMFFMTKNSLIQVIYRCTTTICSWSSIHRVEQHDLFMKVSTRLKNASRNLFTQHG
jgi:hypothetical protein